jgi:hypothetical protein
MAITSDVFNCVYAAIIQGMTDGRATCADGLLFGEAAALATQIELAFSSHVPPIPTAIDSRAKRDVLKSIVSGIIDYRWSTSLSLSADVVANIIESYSYLSGRVDNAPVPVSGISFASFNAVMPGDNADTVAPGTAVDFPNNGPTTADVVTRASASTFTLVEAGTYEVNAQVSVSEAGQLQLAIGGVGLPETVAGRATGTSQIVISTIINVGAGDVLSVINPAGNAAALTITPIAGGTHSVSATLTVKLLAVPAP